MIQIEPADARELVMQIVAVTACGQNLGTFEQGQVLVARARQMIGGEA
ncbi:hypothetical protein [Frigidibacter oleivorans]|nr:hypothetical protein [Frigidibacter oleivorans]